MTYSQKYTLVSFVNAVGSGEEFNMTDWPTHITLADVFAIDRLGSDIDQKLSKLLHSTKPVEAIISNCAKLGNAEVSLIENTHELQKLHNNIVDLLENNKCKFNSPEYTRSGFLPHCNKQKTGQLNKGNVITIREIALIDMYPDKDWRKRKVLNVFKLHS